jgi:hypothetical protein
MNCLNSNHVAVKRRASNHLAQFLLIVTNIEIVYRIVEVIKGVAV